MISQSQLQAKYELDPETVARARANIATKRALVLAVSGHMGSGKDSTAISVMEKLEREFTHLPFAFKLKEEAQEIIDFLWAADERSKAGVQLAAYQNAPQSKCEHMVELLWEDVKSGLVKSAYDRVPSNRAALQYWGTPVRREHDTNYWVKPSVAASLHAVALDQPKFVIVTDARFPNEADAIRDMGGVVVRLDVSREEQLRRLYERDKQLPSNEALEHVSETALDDYSDFDLRVRTDRLSLATVTELIIDYVEGMAITD